MFVNVPDRDLGRCPNLRPSTDAYGYPTNVRCVERSGHDSRCRFPKPPERRDNAGIVYSVGAQEPRQWVAPPPDDDRYE